MKKIFSIMVLGALVAIGSTTAASAAETSCCKDKVCGSCCVKCTKCTSQCSPKTCCKK